MVTRSTSCPSNPYTSAITTRSSVSTSRRRPRSSSRPSLTQKPERCFIKGAVLDRARAFFGIPENREVVRLGQARGSSHLSPALLICDRPSRSVGAGTLVALLQKSRAPPAFHPPHLAGSRRSAGRTVSSGSVGLQYVQTPLHSPQDRLHHSEVACMPRNSRRGECEHSLRARPGACRSDGGGRHAGGVVRSGELGAFGRSDSGTTRTDLQKRRSGTSIWRVEVDEGVVFLYGTSETQEKADWATDLARRTEGVVGVANRMKLDEQIVWSVEPAWGGATWS